MSILSSSPLSGDNNVEVKLPAQRAGHLGANHQTSRVVAGSFFLADDSEYTA